MKFVFMLKNIGRWFSIDGTSVLNAAAGIRKKVAFHIGSGETTTIKENTHTAIVSPSAV
jgi:hypothetical protein